MLFVALCRARAGTTRERTARRIEWQVPAGAKPVAEYWLQTPDPQVILVFEADSVAPIIAAVSAWDDLFDIAVYPAITAEEGLQAAKQMQG